MSDGIFLLQGDELVEMRQQPYDSENVLQTLLEKYPSLLAGEQIGERPLRWLLVKREAGVPAHEGGGGRWSLDHLFVDQDAVPTLVEVKRSDDTRIRREVVGQMLDYAANGVVYWPAERLRFVSRCAKEEKEPEDVFRESLGEDVDSEGFWDDEIPPELRRVIEFLNERMSPTEVIGIEVRQYVGDGELKTLVPRVVVRPSRLGYRRSGHRARSLTSIGSTTTRRFRRTGTRSFESSSIESSAPSLNEVCPGVRSCVAAT
jgi:hypothetical protein